MTRQESRKAMARAALGVAGFAAGCALTFFVPPAGLPICVVTGMALFTLGCRSALRIARVDDLVFEHRPLWRAPDPPVPFPSVPFPERRARLVLLEQSRLRPAATPTLPPAGRPGARRFRREVSI